MKRRHGIESTQLKSNLESLDKRDGEQQISIYKLKAENKGLQEKTIRRNGHEAQGRLNSNAHTFSLLDQLKNKYSMYRDLNQIYSRFYARNVADHLKKEESDHILDYLLNDLEKRFQCSNG